MLPRRRFVPMCFGLLMGLALLCAVPSTKAQGDGQKVFELSIDREQTVLRPRQVNGKQVYYYTVPFQLRRTSDQQIITSVPKTEIVVKEDGKRVHDFELYQPRINKLTTVLAMDISGSMKRATQSSGKPKMDEAKAAARLFLDRLDARADTGLILFNDQLRTQIPPAEDPGRLESAKRRIREVIDNVTPAGGTAYLDATHRSVDMVRDIEGRKAIVVMTDGVDVDSKRTLKEVSKHARLAEIPVYTIGVGDPNHKRDVSTVLVLDRSGSMGEPANVADTRTKIDALKEATGRFIDLMGPGATATVLPFHNLIDTPKKFTNDRTDLKGRIQGLTPEGGTSLYDATFEGIETLMAAQLKGEQYLVVLTDGKDGTPGSRRSVDQVIAHAKRKEIKLYMLGLGSKFHINENVMKRMASETGGEYFHAENERKLVEVFETVSILLHGDGIDEAALTELASSTGGKYHRARNASELDLIYQQLADELQSTYTVTFPSRYQQQDGSVSGIDIYVEREGKRISNVSQADISRHGLIVPKMHYVVYLVLLGVLLAMLAVPSSIRRLYRFYGGGG